MNGRFYRFFFKLDGLTVAAEVVECSSDALALDNAKKPLSESEYNAVEVWQGAAHLVGIIERESR